MKEIMNENKYDIQQQTTTTALEAPDFRQAQCGRGYLF